MTPRLRIFHTPARETKHNRPGNAEVYDRDQQHQRAQGHIFYYVRDSLCNRVQHRFPGSLRFRWIGQLPQRADDKQETDCVYEEGPRHPQGFDHKSCWNWTDNGAQHRRALVDRLCRDQLLALHQRGQIGQSCGNGKCIGHAKSNRQNVQLPRPQNAQPD
jgi:hypothetical protein